MILSKAERLLSKVGLSQISLLCGCEMILECQMEWLYYKAYSVFHIRTYLFSMPDCINLCPTSLPSHWSTALCTIAMLSLICLEPVPCYCNTLYLRLYITRLTSLDPLRNRRTRRHRTRSQQAIHLRRHQIFNLHLDILHARDQRHLSPSLRIHRLRNHRHRISQPPFLPRSSPRPWSISSRPHHRSRQFWKDNSRENSDSICHSLRPFTRCRWPRQS